MDKSVELLGKVVDLLRENGIRIDSPYDVDNFFEDCASHEKLMKTGRFKTDPVAALEELADLSEGTWDKINPTTFFDDLRSD